MPLLTGELVVGCWWVNRHMWICTGDVIISFKFVLYSFDHFLVEVGRLGYEACASFTPGTSVNTRDGTIITSSINYEWSTILTLILTSVLSLNSRPWLTLVLSTLTCSKYMCDRSDCLKLESCSLADHDVTLLYLQILVVLLVSFLSQCDLEVIPTS